MLDTRTATNTAALLAILDWPITDTATMLDQIQHFVNYVYRHPFDRETADKVGALCLGNEKADYQFAISLYGLIGWPEGISPND